MKKKENQLLGALDDDVRQRLASAMSPVDLKLGHVLCEAGGTLEHAYFPQGAVLSLLTVMEDGSAIETANIGREGAFGIFAAMYTRVSFNRSIVQLAGPMIRCSISALEQEFSKSNKVQNLFVSYSETLLSQTQQTVGCNTLHTVEERMCRSRPGDAGQGADCLSPWKHAGEGSRRDGKGVLRVPCHRQTALRFLSEPPAHAAKTLGKGRNTTLWKFAPQGFSGAALTGVADPSLAKSCPLCCVHNRHRPIQRPRYRRLSEERVRAIRHRLSWPNARCRTSIGPGPG